MAPTLVDRPPRAPPVNTVILHNNGRDGDAQVLLRARDARGRLVDPVGMVEKLKEEDSDAFELPEDDDICMDFVVKKQSQIYQPLSRKPR